MVFSEYHLTGMPPVFDEIETGCAQRLTDSLVCGTFGMFEHFRSVLALAIRLGCLHLIRLLVTAYSQCQVEIGIEIVGHRIAVVEVVRHDEIADIRHHLFGPVRQGFVGSDIVMVDFVLDLAGFFGERLEIRFHKPDMDGMAVFASDGKPVSRIGLFQPCPCQLHNLRGMLPFVVAAFPAVFVIDILRVFPCRRSRIVVFVAACACGNIQPVFPYPVQLFKLDVHPLHGGGVAALVRVVL